MQDILTFKDIKDLVAYFYPQLELGNVDVTVKTRVLPWGTDWGVYYKKERLNLPDFYHCNKCGYVLGDLVDQFVTSGETAAEVESAFRNLEGYIGKEYSCRNCNQFIFDVVHSRS